MMAGSKSPGSVGRRRARRSPGKGQKPKKTKKIQSNLFDFDFEPARRKPKYEEPEIIESESSDHKESDVSEYIEEVDEEEPKPAKQPVATSSSKTKPRGRSSTTKTKNIAPRRRRSIQVINLTEDREHEDMTLDQHDVDSECAEKAESKPKAPSRKRKGRPHFVKKKPAKRRAVVISDEESGDSEHVEDFEPKPEVPLRPSSISKDKKPTKRGVITINDEKEEDVEGENIPIARKLNVQIRKKDADPLVRNPGPLGKNPGATKKREANKKDLKFKREGSAQGSIAKVESEKPRTSKSKSSRGKKEVLQSMPLLLPKNDSSMLIVEIDDDKIELDGEVGAIGRLKCHKKEGITFDLKGKIFRASFGKSMGTMAIVNYGAEEARIESVSDSLVSLDYVGSIFDSELLLEGTLKMDDSQDVDFDVNEEHRKEEAEKKKRKKKEKAEKKKSRR